MSVLALVVGIILIGLTTLGMSAFHSANEWRAPVLELSAELREGPRREWHAAVKRRMALMALSLVLLFGVGAAAIWYSRVTGLLVYALMVAVALLFLRQLKGAWQMIRALYSRKVWLLNYLFSPYFFVWRFHHLAEYSDHDIARAICRICQVDDCSFAEDSDELAAFLIELHRRTRPPAEHATYAQVVSNNLAMVALGTGAPRRAETVDIGAEIRSMLPNVGVQWTEIYERLNPYGDDQLRFMLDRFRNSGYQLNAHLGLKVLAAAYDSAVGKRVASDVSGVSLEEVLQEAMKQHERVTERRQ